MSKIRKYASGAKWENLVGYSRAIRIDNTIEIAGTTALNENGQVVGWGDPAEQTRQIIRIAEKALKAMGSNLKDVIRTRIYCTDITAWEAIGRAHGEFFRDIKPVSTMVEVSGLVSPDLLVEIEFSAIVPS